MTNQQKITRKKRVRAKIRGTASRPRLSVFRSNKNVYAQLIDDERGVTLAHARGADAKVVGAEISALAKKKKIKTVVFDRGAYKYHGKLQALADGAREGGLIF